jgi:hypothetical protein
MADFAFESIVTKHPEAFNEDTVARCTARLAAWVQA